MNVNIGQNPIQNKHKYSIDYFSCENPAANKLNITLFDPLVT